MPVPLWRVPRELCETRLLQRQGLSLGLQGHVQSVVLASELSQEPDSGGHALVKETRTKALLADSHYVTTCLARLVWSKLR